MKYITIMKSAKKPKSILSSSPAKKKQTQDKQMFPKRTFFLESSVAARNRLTAFRTYGFMKTTSTGTPYPRCADPLDSGMLSARLAVASKFKSKVKSSDDVDEIESASDVINECSISNLMATDEPKMVSFEERRKLFDLAEFTICKGRKLGDYFHHHSDIDIDVLLANSRQRFDGSVGNYSNFTLTSSKSQSLGHFKEMEAFCLSRNIRLNHGLEFGIAKKF